MKNAILAGAKGIILFSDPVDYCAPGVEVYPDGWNLPGGGAQRGNVLNLNGAGDPLTPGYPAKGGGSFNIPTSDHLDREAETFTNKMTMTPVLM